MMDILMSETRWLHKKWNKIASDIKLVFYSSTMSLFICYITGNHQNFHIGSTWHSLNTKRTCGHNVNVWLFLIISGESITKCQGNLNNWTFFLVEHGRQGDWQTGLFSVHCGFCSAVSTVTTVWTAWSRVWIPVRARDLCLLQNHRDQLWEPTQPPIQC